MNALTIGWNQTKGDSTIKWKKHYNDLDNMERADMLQDALGIIQAEYDRVLAEGLGMGVKDERGEHVDEYGNVKGMKEQSNED